MNRLVVMLVFMSVSLLARRPEWPALYIGATTPGMGDNFLEIGENKVQDRVAVDCHRE
jgi:hypothetical protein